METVAQEDFFQAAGTFTVYFHFIKKVVLIFISCFKHGGKSILSRVAGAGGECIEYAVDEYCAEGAAAVALCQPGIGPVIQFVRNAADTDTLTGIAESFGTGNEQHVIVRIVCHRRLVRRLERFAQVLAEVHGKVGEVFQHNDVILGCQFADDAQLFFFQANPAGVVGIGIDDGRDIAFAEVTFQLRFQLVATVVIYVKGFIFLSHHDQLLLLYRETGIDEENGILFLIALATCEE